MEGGRETWHQRGTFIRDPIKEVCLKEKLSTQNLTLKVQQDSDRLRQPGSTLTQYAANWDIKRKLGKSKNKPALQTVTKDGIFGLHPAFSRQQLRQAQANPECRSGGDRK